MEQLSFGWEISKGIQILKEDKKKTVFVDGKAYMNWIDGDETAERMAIVQLYELGLGTQEDLARIFQMHINSIAKYISTFKTEGAGSLISQPRGPRQSWKLLPEVRADILMIMLKEGVSEYAAIQRRLEKYWGKKVSIESIRQVLIENGFVREGIEIPRVKQRGLFDDTDPRQLSLFDYAGELPRIEQDKDKPSLPVIPKKKGKSQYSQAQRIYLDQLEQGGYNTYAGGLLFAPLLEQYDFIPTIRRVINTEMHEGYSLDELSLTLFYFDLFRFESMENFKTVYPEEFGALIGRSSSPSIFTLRRFLHKVRKLDKAERLSDEFAKGYLKSGLTRWGLLYIDGHFLPYYGIYPISKGWHSVRKIPMKGSYNFLTVDEGFSPFLFLIRASSEDLLQKIPEIVLKAKEIAKEAGITGEKTKDLTVIFDREGYSAELFRTLDDEEFKVKFISWAKYADRWVNDIEEKEFDKTATVTYEIQDSEEIKYLETKRLMKKYGKIRTIVIQSGKDKKRAAIYTNDKEAEAERLIQLICRRWGQENLIKTLVEKHLIDYSPGYEPEEIENQPMVENPRVKELKQERTNLKAELSQLKSGFGHEVIEEMFKEANWDEIKKKHISIMAKIEIIHSKITLLAQEIDKLPQKIRFDEAHGKRLLELNYEKKRFLDCIKIFTCNMEKQMCRFLLSHYDIKKEIQPALAMIVRRGGFVRLKDGELKVRLRGFKNPEIDYAARHLCEDLNKMKPTTLDKFRLPIHYEVA